MSGITTGVGIFSGIDTGNLIEQLIAVESRPKIQFQQRILSLQLLQGGYLDINSKLSALQSAAASFRTQKTFSSKTATSSNESSLTATAGVGATQGTYSFIVDRLVSTRQLLSRGFADRDATALDAGSFVFESSAGRLDREIKLADLNGGQGVERGEFTITAGSNTYTVDVSTAANVSEVIETINGSGAGVSASVQDGSIVLSSSQAFTVADATGSATATTLGIAGASSTSGSSEVLTGSQVYRLSTDAALSILNDGNGVYSNDQFSTSRYDFIISVNDGSGATDVKVNIGPIYETVDDETTATEAAATTVGTVIDRINTALSDAGFGDVTAEIDSAGTGLRIDDGGNTTWSITVGENTALTTPSTTAADLGLLTISGTTRDGTQVLSGLNTTLVSNLNGGSGLSGDGTIDFTDRNGVGFTSDVSGLTTVSAAIAQINADAEAAGADIAVTLNEAGTGLLVTDTSGGSSNLIVTGSSAGDLGIDTGAAGVADDSVLGTSLQHAYVTGATRLADLNDGQGIGTGKFTVTDGFGASHRVNIGESVKTVAELIAQINGQTSASGLKIHARINDNGDGVVIEEDTDGGPAGTLAIKIEDTEGSVAKNLRLEGEASGTDADNFINGSSETTIEFDASDTLDDIVTKINNADAGVAVTVINDQSSSTPYRLSIVSRRSGTAGRFTLDTQGFDLGVQVLDRGTDARVFFGSSDPAKGVLLQSSTNTLDQVLTGVTIDLKGTSSDPVELNVATNTDAIETNIQAFVDAFNGVITRIDEQTKYDTETKKRGTLLGDSTVIGLRQTLFNMILGTGDNLEGQYTSLNEVGVRIGTSGQLEFNRDRFRDVLAEDPQAVADLFQKRDLTDNKGPQEIAPGVFVSGGFVNDEFSALGVAGKIEELVKGYINSIDGILTERNRTINDQIKAQQDRIAAFDVRLQSRREILSRQFLAMEQAIAQIQTQQSALLGLGLNG